MLFQLFRVLHNIIIHFLTWHKFCTTPFWCETFRRCGESAPTGARLEAWVLQLFYEKRFLWMQLYRKIQKKCVRECVLIAVWIRGLHKCGDENLMRFFVIREMVLGCRNNSKVKKKSGCVFEMFVGDLVRKCHLVWVSVEFFQNIYQQVQNMFSRNTIGSRFIDTLNIAKGCLLLRY